MIGESTDLGEVLFTGQRKPDGVGSFPTRGGEGYEEMDTVTLDPNDPPTSPDPCNTPASKRDWNADAAAADLLKEIKIRAMALDGDDGPYVREWGAQLYERPDGSVYAGPITYGNPLTGTFDYDESNINGDTIVAEFHTHPGGGRVPSGADWTRLDIYAGDTGQAMRGYIYARDTTDPTSQFKTRVYDSAKSNRNFNVIGPEINPDGQQCPL